MAIFKDGLIRQGASGASAVYTIDNSIRFNQADSPYMEKTYSGDGSRTTWSFSFWMKLGKSPPYNTSRANPLIVYNTTSGAQEDIRIEGTNQQLQWYTHNDGGSGTLADLKTTQYLRDHSAWYHILCVADRTNAISSERQKIYINGQRVTDFATETYPSKDAEGHVGKSADVHYIGSRAGNSNTRFDGYLAEIVYIDGTALDPSSFGELNSSNIWIPKNVSGLTFGTNGFHIDGSDSSDLGKNVATGNTFATYASTNLQTNDQRVDTPTNNQITFNPLNNQRSGGTLSNGNLDYVGPGTRTNISLTANIPSTGKWAVAYKVGQVSTNSGWQIGLSTANDSDFGDAVGSNEDLDLCRIQPTSSNGEVNDKINNAYITPTLPITTSDEFWVAVDMDTGNIFFGIYDASDTTMKFIAADGDLDGDPSTGANPTVTSTTTSMPRDNVVFSVGSKQTDQFIYLQRSTDVSGTIPTGYTYFENVKDIL